MISSNSKKFLEGIKDLLIEFDIEPTINLDRAKYKLTISKLEDCIKVFFYIYPYMISNPKMRSFVNSFFTIRILNILTIKNTRDLINEWKSKLGNWEGLKRILENKYDYKATLKTIRLFGLTSNIPPLSAIIEACKTSNKNIFDYLPNWYAGILWLFKTISKNKFQEMRGL